MKKRSGIKIISFSIAALIAAAGFIFIAERKNRKYRIQIENSYSRSLEDLSAGINNISLTLQKAQYVTTPAQISSMAARLLTEAEVSKNALSQLPAGEELTTVNKFLSQVGNYAMSVSKKLISTGDVTQEDKANISALSDTANKVAEIVNNTQITYNNASYWAKELDNEIDSAVDSESLASDMAELEGELTDYPTLVYDGPYSDHILEKEPAMLKSAEKVSQSEALAVAAKAAECDKSDLSYDGDVAGNIPSYRFVGQGITVTVSTVGGYTVYMRKEREVADSLLSYEQALEKAKRYLERVGLKGFTETYYVTTEGVCVVNFAYLDGETVCYTDLIKVGVAMDNGEIMLYEASGYISNHTDRAFLTPDHTVEEARAILSGNLTLTETAVALIPTDYGEARCYEFTCRTADGQEILVYINVNTLAEEDILILLKSDGGTLVK